jgi:hypothetical protein
LVEKNLEISKVQIEEVIDDHQKEITSIVYQVEDIKGPVMTTVANTKKESETLMRELGRAQVINREIVNERAALDPSAILRSTTPIASISKEDFSDYPVSSGAPSAAGISRIKVHS